MTSRSLCGCALAAVLVSASIMAQDRRSELRALQPKIDRAIDDGVRWLIDQQLPDGSWAYMENEYPNGSTALAVYTLLKSGVSAKHKAVARGLAFLKRSKANKTYALALQMMAYEATKDAAYKPLIKALLKDLISWQDDDGAFGYPGFPGGGAPPGGRPGGRRPGGGRPGGWQDLSNTQYAALGLRSAMLAGIKIKKRVLSSLLAETLEYQESQQQVKLPPDPEKKERSGYARTPGDSGIGYSAGFFYNKQGQGHGRLVTGSMTTAGLGVVLIVRDCYGKSIPKRVDNKIRRIVTLGLNWMRKNWSVTENPGMGGGGRRGGRGMRGNMWHYYYLYGLERVGSLLMEEVIAGHAWYLEGSRVLVRQQANDGSWLGGQGEQPDTCFALLFLRRATWAGRTTGRGAETEPVADLHGTESGDVRLKGQGSSSLAMWVDGFAPKILQRWQRGQNKTDLRIIRVDYFVDGKPAKTVEGSQARIWKGETFAAKHEFERPGSYTVTAKVHVLPPGAKRRDADTELVVLESGSFKVEVARVADASAEEMSRALEGNRVRSASVSVEATSNRSLLEKSGAAVDGREATGWVCRASDATPTITLRFKKTVKANHVMLTQSFRRSAGGRGRRGREPIRRVKRVEIRVNNAKKPTVTAALDSEGRPSRIDLPKEMRVRSLRITVVERAVMDNGACGFTEIYVY